MSVKHAHRFFVIKFHIHSLLQHPHRWCRGIVFSRIKSSTVVFFFFFLITGSWIRDDAIRSAKGTGSIGVDQHRSCYHVQAWNRERKCRELKRSCECFAPSTITECNESSGTDTGTSIGTRAASVLLFILSYGIIYKW